jgi:hypothetical protein
MQPDAPLSPLLLRAINILLALLRLRLPAAWKSMQLSVVMLWNAGVRSGVRAPYRQLVVDAATHP